MLSLQQTKRCADRPLIDYVALTFTYIQETGFFMTIQCNKYEQIHQFKLHLSKDSV